jgi:restriction system protein
MGRRRRSQRKAGANLIAFLFLITLALGSVILMKILEFIDVLIANVRAGNMQVILIIMAFGIVGSWLLYRAFTKFQKQQRMLFEEANERLRQEEMRRIERERRLRTLQGIQEMDPFEFEHLVARLFQRQGYVAEVTSRSNDGGKDIILQKDGRKMFVECKRYNDKKKVGRPEMQKFHSALIDGRAYRGFFVTTSDFAQTAHEYAKGKNIQLINGVQLLGLLENHAE